MWEPSRSTLWIFRAPVRGRRYDCVMVDPALLSQAKQLDVADRVELISELWDSIDADDVPVTPETVALIDERLREADAAPLEGSSWEEVEAELRARLP